MEVNTLVTHSKMRSLGIGCVAKIFKNNVAVNFGSDDVIKVKLELLKVVDTSKCKTITFSEFQRQTVANTVKDDTLIIGNEVKHYVGIGWISQSIVTLEDLKKYKRLVY